MSIISETNSSSSSSLYSIYYADNCKPNTLLLYFWKFSSTLPWANLPSSFLLPARLWDIFSSISSSSAYIPLIFAWISTYNRDNSSRSIFYVCSNKALMCFLSSFTMRSSRSRNTLEMESTLRSARYWSCSIASPCSWGRDWSLVRMSERHESVKLLIIGF